MSSELTLEIRQALCTICHDYMVSFKLSQAKFRKDHCQIDSKHLSNFLSSASQNSSDILYKYFKGVCDERYISNSPEYIRLAIRECYGYPDEDDNDQIISYNDVITRITDDDDQSVKFLEHQLLGIWHVFRYSSHLSEGHLEPDNSYLPRSTVDGSLDAFTVRAICEITEQRRELKPRTIDSASAVLNPKFELRYKPKSMASKEDFLPSKGVLISAHSRKYVIMAGFEPTHNFPISIVAEQNFQNSSSNEPKPRKEDSFVAIVRRKHEKGPVIVSRCVFVRERNSYYSIDDFNEKIGIKNESKLREEIKEEFPFMNVDTIINLMTNNVPNQGKMTLML